MDQSMVMDAIMNLTLGTVVAWVVVIIGIVGTISGGTVKLYKCFLAYQKTKDRSANLQNAVDNHEKAIEELKQQISQMNNDLGLALADIKMELESHRTTKIKELRHSLTIAGEQGLSDGEMTIRQWNSLHEMFDEYKNKYGQNSYVESLMEKVDRDVKIIGQLDEHGKDIV